MASDKPSCYILLTLFLNPRSGSVSEKTAEELSNLLGPELVIQDIGGEDLRTRVREAARKGTVAVGGGDGTVAAVATCLVGTEHPLGILPLGTLNHLARDLNIPNDLQAAARVVLEGAPTVIDTGCVNERPFVNNSSLGLYPRLVLYREMLERKGVPRWAALCSAGFYLLMHYRTVHVEFEIEGKRVRRKTPLVFVGNNIYTLQGLKAGSREKLADGVLSVVIAREQRAWRFCIGMLKALAGLVERNNSLEILHLKAVTVRTRSKRAVVSTDGEVSVLRSPLEYSIRPRSLTVLVPSA